MNDFNYKQRPWSRAVSQAEWDAIFSTRSCPVAIKAVDSPTTHTSPEAVAASPSGDGSGRPAPPDFVTKAGTRIFIPAAPFEIPSTRYAVVFAEGCD